MFERILVAIDGSDTSNRALATATQMAKSFGERAQLRLLHVLDAPLALGGTDTFTQNISDMQNNLELGRDAGNELLRDAQQVALAAGLEADTELLERYSGDLGSQVASAALRWRADLIVVGTHGRHGLGRVLLGSGAEDIVRKAPVPVLVVRLPAAAK